MEPGTAPFDQDQPFVTVGIHNTQVLGGHPLCAHVTGHFLALEHLARVLTLTGRTVRTMRNRHTMSCPQSAEVVPLHRTGKTLTDRRPVTSTYCPETKCVADNSRTDIDKRIFCDTEFDDLAARLHLGFGKVPPHGLADTLGLCGPGAELQAV